MSDDKNSSIEAVNNNQFISREIMAEKLAKLICTMKKDDISPLMISGDWGTGKTTFCNEWLKTKIHESDVAENATNLPYQCIYIDAFLHDHLDDPLLVIINQIIFHFSKDKTPAEITDEIILRSVVALGIFLLKPVGYLTGIATGITLEDCKKLWEGLTAKTEAKTTEEMLSDIPKELFSEFQKKYNELNKEMELLKNILKAITSEQPLVIIIDELDRCKPSFAVKMLEVIKHVFEEPEIKFILVTNLTQLEKNIQHFYGAIDANRYLDKFFKFRCALPSVFKEDESNQLEYIPFKHFINIKQEKASVNEYFSNEMDNFFYELILINQLSLREVETFLRYLEIYIGLSDKENTGIAERYYEVLGVFLYYFRREVADQLLINKPFDANSDFVDQFAKAIGVYVCISNDINMHALIRSRLDHRILALKRALKGKIDSEEKLPTDYYLATMFYAVSPEKALVLLQTMFPTLKRDDWDSAYRILLMGQEEPFDTNRLDPSQNIVVITYMSNTIKTLQFM